MPGTDPRKLTYDQIADIVPKEKDKPLICSKPKYFIFVKREFFSAIEAIDLPKLREEINKSYAKLEETKT